MVIFNPQTIKDQGSYVQPDQYLIGTEYVFVNGEFTLKKGKYTGVKSGRVSKKRVNKPSFI